MIKRQYWVIGFALVLVAGITFTFTMCEEDSTEAPQPPGNKVVPGEFVQGLGNVPLGSTANINYKLKPEAVESVTLLLDGVEVDAPAPAAELQYEWNTSGLKCGVHEFTLDIKQTNGTTYTAKSRKTIVAPRAPVKKRAIAVNMYPHDPQAFTQGLEFDGDRLLESTGERGSSTVREVDVEKGTVIHQTKLENRLFGEGITLFDDKIYQVTYTSGEGFVYDKDSFNLLDRFSFSTNTGEGWGLTHDDKHIIMSDGSHRLYFVNPTGFMIEKTIEVYTDQMAMSKLNELEYINGKIYANVWQTTFYVVIDPTTGVIEEMVEMRGLIDHLSDKLSPDVLNGIAYKADTDQIFVTGKKWPLLFEIETEIYQ